MMANGSRPASTAAAAAPPPELRDAAAVTNRALAERIKAVTAGHVPADDAIERELLLLLNVTLAADPPAPAAPVAAAKTGPTVHGDEDEDDEDEEDSDTNEDGLPTLLPLYLAKLLEVVEATGSTPSEPPAAAGGNLRDRIDAAASAFLLRTFDDARPLRERTRGAVALALLLRTCPSMATRLLVAHADAVLEPIADTLEQAADRPCWHKPAVARLVVASLDVLAQAAAHAPLRALIGDNKFKVIPTSLRTIARQASRGAGPVSMTTELAATAGAHAANVLAKLGINTTSSAPSTPTTASAPAPAAAATDAGFDPEALVAAITAESASRAERESAMEALALASLRIPVRRSLSKASLLVLLATMRAGGPRITPSLAFGFVTLLHHLTMYPLALTPEQRQLRRLARFAKSGMSAAAAAAGAAAKDAPPAANDEEDDDESAVSARCLMLLDMHVVAVLAAVYRHQSQVTGGKVSSALVAGIARIGLDLARVPAHRGKMVQQGAVGLLARAARTERAAAQALARCAITLNPAVAFQDALIAPLAAQFWHLVPDPTAGSDASPFRRRSSVASSSQGAPSSGAPAGDANDPLAHYEALLALTNLSTHAGVVPSHLSWLERLDRSGSLTADNPEIRRAAWELLGNMLCCGPDMVEACATNPRRLRLLLHLGVAHAHVDERFEMRRAATGVLAMLSFAPETIAALLTVHRDGDTDLADDLADLSIDASSLPTTPSPDSPLPLARLLALTLDEPSAEIAHRVLQLWLNVAHVPAATTWARVAKVPAALRALQARFPAHAEVRQLVADTLQLIAAGGARE
ncbi:SWI5-dependent HO expression protein 4 [Blastocladiella emersonii ATCC 22665]|nr:SWI5-dependent HO expression protein 4 [Blastocladiella emersonii ATCC 22665]